MTDVLTERFAALADLNDDSDWLEVRRRARRRRTGVAVPAAIAAALALLAAAAVAAGNGWLFTSHDRQVTAETHVAFRGQTWRVTLTTRSGSWLSRVCVRVSRPGGSTISTGCGASSPTALRPPFGARHVDVAGGQIWAGATAPFIRRIVITDAAGRPHSTRTIGAPRGTKTPFHYWVVALDSSTGRSIVAYDSKGRAIRKALG